MFRLAALRTLALAYSREWNWYQQKNSPDWRFLLMIIYSLLMLSGFVVLLKGADLFVDGAARLARGMNVSPMAVGLLRQRLSQEGLASRFKVLSAGVWALDDHPASENAIAVMAERGIDITDHVAHTITHDHRATHY